VKNSTDLIKHINILAVDDMEAILGLVKGCLRNLGAANVDTAMNGEAAWQLLKQKRYHMIICDWDMPKMSGLTLLKNIRGSTTYKDLPFLLLTATVDKEHVIRAVEAGVSDYLSKPFRPKELEFRVVKLLRKVNIDEN
jgi:two-component system chemotaxis response regulator CheY